MCVLGVRNLIIAGGPAVRRARIEVELGVISLESTDEFFHDGPSRNRSSHIVRRLPVV